MLFRDVKARQYAGSWPCSFNEDGTEPSDSAPSNQCVVNALAGMRENDYDINLGVGSALSYIKLPGYNWRVAVSELQYRYRMPEGPNTYFKIIVQEGFKASGDTEFTPTSEKTLTWSGGITVDEVFIPATPGNDDSWATEWQSQDAPVTLGPPDPESDYPESPTIESANTGKNGIISTRYRCFTGGPWVYS